MKELDRLQVMTACRAQAHPAQGVRGPGLGEEQHLVPLSCHRARVPRFPPVRRAL